MNTINFHKKKDNTSLIVFYNGWGMDSLAIQHLDTGYYDIVEINDYRTIDPLDLDFSQYDEVFLVAWSMGVWAAAQTATHIKFKKAIAINGTQDPVDDHEGIPQRIFQGTIQNWNENNREKFNMRIVGGKHNYSKLKNILNNRNHTEQKEELIAIQHHIENGYSYLRHFDYSIIGEKDAIFTPQNQLKAWKEIPNLVLDIPHYPFIHFKSWEEIININDR